MDAAALGLAGRHLLSTLDFSREELRGLVDLALAYKRGDPPPPRLGSLLALLFFNPSVRTRLSCTAAVGRLGGQAAAVTPGSDTWRFECGEGVVMDGATQEHVKELAPVLSGYCDWVGIRRSELATTSSASGAVSTSYAELARDEFMNVFAAHSAVPVVNLESNRFHPLQGLADMATMVERLGDPRGRRYVLTWAWHPKSLPAATPHSQLLAAAHLGMDVQLLRPEGWDLEDEVVDTARDRAEAAGGSLHVTADADAAYRGAHVVCAKSWGALDAYGHFEEEAQRKRELRGAWIVDQEKMARTDDAFFLHCLPIRRNVIATDAVLDSRRAAHLDEAENRMWTALAALAALART